MDVDFEAAADAIVGGDLAALDAIVKRKPELIHARSALPHHATLLHYVAANGVEDERQKSPKNAPEIARYLLKAGAAVDATAEMYGAPQTTMKMLVSSAHPAKAGVQDELVETLADFGADIQEPLIVALAHGYLSAAQTLVKRGARVDTLTAAAGLGRLAEATHLLPNADAEERHRALALGAQHGHAEVVRLLLDAGEDPDRYNPQGFHAHSTPLHQAGLNGHEAVVKLLVERGARTDLRDKVYQGTPRGWADHAGRENVRKYL